MPVQAVFRQYSSAQTERNAPIDQRRINTLQNENERAQASIAINLYFDIRRPLSAKSNDTATKRQHCRRRNFPPLFEQRQTDQRYQTRQHRNHAQHRQRQTRRTHPYHRQYRTVDRNRDFFAERLITQPSRPQTRQRQRRPDNADQKNRRQNHPDDAQNQSAENLPIQIADRKNRFFDHPTHSNSMRNARTRIPQRFCTPA